MKILARNSASPENFVGFSASIAKVAFSAADPRLKEEKPERKRLTAVAQVAGEILELSSAREDRK